MASQRLRLSKAEIEERLVRLKNLNVRIGRPDNPAPKAKRIVLRQTDYDFPRVCDLPSGRVLVIVPAKLTVPASGILITEAEMTLPWDDDPLDLNDPEALDDYQNQVGGSYNYPLKALNPFLLQNVPLRPRQEEGVIFASGSCPVPPTCHDGQSITVKLLLVDERGNELRFYFQAEVNRSAKHKYERQERLRRSAVRSSKRVPIFKKEGGPPGGANSASPPEALQSLPPEDEREPLLRRKSKPH